VGKKVGRKSSLSKKEIYIHNQTKQCKINKPVKH